MGINVLGVRRIRTLQEAKAQHAHVTQDMKTRITTAHAPVSYVNKITISTQPIKYANNVRNTLHKTEEASINSIQLVTVILPIRLLRPQNNVLH